MGITIFASVYIIAAAIHTVVSLLAVDERARAFKSLSPGMLPPLGIIFGLLVGFTAVQVWNDFDRAKASVTSEASALRSAFLLSESLASGTRDAIRARLAQHIEQSVTDEWAAMSEQRASLRLPPRDLSEGLRLALTFTPANESERAAQREIISSLQAALEARRHRIIVSQSAVSPVKWTGLLLQAFITLIAIALVHSDNRLTSAIALGLFSTGVGVCVLLIAAYNHPFQGDISVGPELLQEVMPAPVGARP